MDTVQEEKTFTVDAKHLLICQELLFTMKPKHAAYAAAEVLEKHNVSIDPDSIQIEGMRGGFSNRVSTFSFKVLDNDILQDYKFVERKPTVK
jgi:hypothetical protein